MNSIVRAAAERGLYRSWDDRRSCRSFDHGAACKPNRLLDACPFKAETKLLCHELAVTPHTRSRTTASKPSPNRNGVW